MVDSTIRFTARKWLGAVSRCALWIAVPMLGIGVAGLIYWGRPDTAMTDLEGKLSLWCLGLGFVIPVIASFVRSRVNEVS